MYMTSEGCFTNVPRALQNNLLKIHNARNHTSCENFELERCTCTQSMPLGTRTKFQLKIITRSKISSIRTFQETISESSRDVSEAHKAFRESGVVKCSCLKCLQASIDLHVVLKLLNMLLLYITYVKRNNCIFATVAYPFILFVFCFLFPPVAFALLLCYCH